MFIRSVSTHLKSEKRHSKHKLDSAEKRLHETRCRCKERPRVAMHHVDDRAIRKLCPKERRTQTNKPHDKNATQKQVAEFSSKPHLGEQPG